MHGFYLVSLRLAVIRVTRQRECRHNRFPQVTRPPGNKYKARKGKASPRAA
jgi:hypothetical protein